MQSSQTDWTTQLKELRDAVHELDGRLERILVNLDEKCGLSKMDTETPIARELDELGEY